MFFVVFIFNPLLFYLQLNPNTQQSACVCEYKPKKATSKDAKKAMNMIIRSGTSMWRGDDGGTLLRIHNNMKKLAHYSQFPWSK